MKKLILILAALPLFALSIAAQNSDREKLKQLNLQTVQNFKAGNIDGALALAKQAIDLTAKVPADDDESASAYFNLGTVYRFKKKYKEATENLQKALSIYQLNAAKNAGSIAKTLHGLADVYALDGDEKKAAENYTLAFTTAETAYGKDAKDLLPFLKSMGDVYIFDKKYDEAQEIFVRRHQITTKNLPNDSDASEQIDDEFYCFVNTVFNGKEIAERTRKFRDAIKTEEEKKREEKIKTVSGGVVNSTAVNLVKPEYPSTARARRARGKVTVRVTIDKEGNVSEARAICGDKDLRGAAQAAAKKSKFKPTMLLGQPVEVTGVIIYNFVAP